MFCGFSGRFSKCWWSLGADDARPRADAHSVRGRALLSGRLAVVRELLLLVGPGVVPRPVGEWKVPVTFVVVRMGINVQGVFGTYPSKKAATAAARDKASRDIDSYHEWQVQPLTPDGLGEAHVSFRYDGPPRPGYWNEARAHEPHEPGPVRQML